MQGVDTSFTMEVIAKSEQYETVIPSTTPSISFIQFAADNNDFNEEMLDDKNRTHATTMVVYQCKPFCTEPPPTVAADHSKKKNLLRLSPSVLNPQTPNDILPAPVVPSSGVHLIPCCFHASHMIMGYCPMIDGSST